MAKMNSDLRTRKRAIQNGLNELREQRKIVFSRWFGATGATRKTLEREYYGILAAIRELRGAIVDIKREANLAR